MSWQPASASITGEILDLVGREALDRTLKRYR